MDAKENESNRATENVAAEPTIERQAIWNLIQATEYFLDNPHNGPDPDVYDLLGQLSELSGIERRERKTYPSQLAEVVDTEEMIAAVDTASVKTARYVTGSLCVPFGPSLFWDTKTMQANDGKNHDHLPSIQVALREDVSINWAIELLRGAADKLERHMNNAPVGVVYSAQNADDPDDKEVPF